MDPTMDSAMTSLPETLQEEALDSGTSGTEQKRALQQSPSPETRSRETINLDSSDEDEYPHHSSKRQKQTHEQLSDMDKQDTHEHPRSPLHLSSPLTTVGEMTRTPEAGLPTVMSWNKGVQSGKTGLRTSFSSKGPLVSTAVPGNKDALSQLLSSQKTSSTPQDSIRDDQVHVSTVPIVEAMAANTLQHTAPSSTLSHMQINNTIPPKHPTTSPGKSKPYFTGKGSRFPILKGEPIYRNSKGDFILSEVLRDGEHIHAKYFNLVIFAPAFLTDNLTKISALKARHVKGAFTTYIGKYYSHCKDDTAPARDVAGTEAMTKLITRLLEEKRSELAQWKNSQLPQQKINDQPQSPNSNSAPIIEPSIQRSLQESNTVIKPVSRPAQGLAALRANDQPRPLDIQSFRHNPNIEREPLPPSNKKNAVLASNSGPQWRPPPTMTSSHETGNGPALMNSSEYYKPTSAQQKEKQGDENLDPGHSTREYYEASVSRSGELRDVQGTTLNELHQEHGSMRTVHSTVYGNHIEMSDAENPTSEEITGRSTTDHDDALELELSEVELELQMKYFPSTNPSKQRCLACAEAGHRTINCPYLTCSSCGVTGYHTTAACPQNQRCGKCWQHGHSTSQCREKLLPNKDEAGGCTLCNSKDHLEWACHLIWRSFNPKPEEIIKVRDIPVSCYFCGGIGHFGVDCGLRVGPISSGGITWSQANLQKYLEPSSRQRAIFAAPEYSITSKPKKDFSIKGRANDPITLNDSDSDDVTFIQAKIVKSGAKHGSISIKGKGVESFQKDPRRILAQDDSARHAREQSFSPPPNYVENNNENYRPPWQPQNGGQLQTEGFDRPMQDFYPRRYDSADDEPASAGEFTTSIRGRGNRGRGRGRGGASRRGGNTDGDRKKNSDRKKAVKQHSSVKAAKKAAKRKASKS